MADAPRHRDDRRRHADGRDTASAAERKAAPVRRDSRVVKKRVGGSAVKGDHGSVPLPADADESQLYLDYLPIVNRRPIDVQDRLRVTGGRIAIAICVTVYTEGADELQRTLEGIAENLAALSTEGRKGVRWQDVCVFVIVDGRETANPSLLDFAKHRLRCYDPMMLARVYDGQDVQLHVFERTVPLLRHEASREFFFPLQLSFCVKEKNGGKLNSHLWFFQAFCRQVQPRYTFQVDVGTVAREDSMRAIFHSMEANPQLGGCCGEIVVSDPKLHNFLVAAQQFEYKIAHVMEKSMESWFGFVSVLPGAFCCYRWKAIQGAPLAQYFTVEERTLHSLGPLVANMYLAEDRVMCFEVATKRSADWTLHYRYGAVAETDVPQTLVELIKQRRRWINGSWFSLVYYLTKLHTAMRKSGHSCFRRAGFYLQFVYQLLNLVITWLTTGSFYISQWIVLRMTFAHQEFGSEIMFIVALVYGALVLVQVLVSMGSKPVDASGVHFVCMFTWGILLYLVLALSVVRIVDNEVDELVVVAGATSIGVYFVCALLHGELVNVALTLLQYLFVLPTYINILTTYSFCNIHDTSWGTKEARVANLGDERDALIGRRGAGAAQSPGERPAIGAGAQRVLLGMLERVRKREAEARKKRAEAIARERVEAQKLFVAFRTRILAAWLLSNVLYVAIIINFQLDAIFAWFLAAALLLTLMYRLVGSVMYQVERLLKVTMDKCCGRRYRLCCCTSKKLEQQRRDSHKLWTGDASISPMNRTEEWFLSPSTAHGRKRVLRRLAGDTGEVFEVDPSDTFEAAQMRVTFRKRATRLAPTPRHDYRRSTSTPVDGNGHGDAPRANGGGGALHDTAPAAAAGLRSPAQPDASGHGSSYESLPPISESRPRGAARHTPASTGSESDTTTTETMTDSDSETSELDTPLALAVGDDPGETGELPRQNSGFRTRPRAICLDSSAATPPDDGEREALMDDDVVVLYSPQRTRDRRSVASTLLSLSLKREGSMAKSVASAGSARNAVALAAAELLDAQSHGVDGVDGGVIADEENGLGGDSGDGEREYIGVWQDARGRYVAALQDSEGVEIRLGSYSDPRVAAHVYDTAARHHYGRAAKLNFPEGLELRDDAASPAESLTPTVGEAVMAERKRSQERLARKASHEARGSRRSLRQTAAASPRGADHDTTAPGAASDRRGGPGDGAVMAVVAAGAEPATVRDPTVATASEVVVTVSDAAPDEGAQPASAASSSELTAAAVVPVATPVASTGQSDAPAGGSQGNSGAAEDARMTHAEAGEAFVPPIAAKSKGVLDGTHDDLEALLLAGESAARRIIDRDGAGPAVARSDDAALCDDHLALSELADAVDEEADLQALSDAEDAAAGGSAAAAEAAPSLVAKPTAARFFVSTFTGSYEPPREIASPHARVATEEESCLRASAPSADVLRTLRLSRSDSALLFSVFWYYSAVTSATAPRTQNKSQFRRFLVDAGVVAPSGEPTGAAAAGGADEGGVRRMLTIEEVDEVFHGVLRTAHSAGAPVVADALEYSSFCSVLLELACRQRDVPLHAEGGEAAAVSPEVLTAFSQFLGAHVLPLAEREGQRLKAMRSGGRLSVAELDSPARDPGVRRVLRANHDGLLALYKAYSGLDDDPTSLAFDELLRLARDFGITPGILSADELRALFDDENSGTGVSTVTFSQFQRVLFRASLQLTPAAFAAARGGGGAAEAGGSGRRCDDPWTPSQHLNALLARMNASGAFARAPRGLDETSRLDSFVVPDEFT